MDSHKPPLDLTPENIYQNFEIIDLKDLSDLSGYSVEMIKDQLGLSMDQIPVELLRERMLVYLDSAMKR